MTSSLDLTGVGMAYRGMRTRAIVVTAALVLAAPWNVAHAGPAEVAAALPNEQSECRYLLGMCKRAEEQDGEKALLTMIDIGKAAQVIRAKHEKMPACFRKCPSLNLERFK